MSDRITRCLCTISIAAIILLAGCQKPYSLALRFEPNDMATYRVATERVHIHKFDQPSQKRTDEKQKWSKSTVTFSQYVNSVDTQGNAVVDVVIEGIKYFSKGLNRGVLVDFDSDRPRDQKKPLAHLIGHRYTIKVSPAGHVEVLDANDARQAVGGKSREAMIAKKLLTDESIKRRHEISSSLPDVACKKVGDSWKRQQEGPIRMMMQKSYEKTYAFKQVKIQNGHKVAIIDMDASAVSAETDKNAMILAMFAAIADSHQGQDNFRGRLEFNLDTGKVEKYGESLLSEWTAKDKSKQDEGVVADRLTLGYQYMYTVERIKDSK